MDLQPAPRQPVLRQTSRAGGVSGTWPSLFVSRVGGDRAIPAMLGEAHYSYHFVADKFHAMLARAGHAPRVLAMPEYYATRAAMPDPPPGPWVHLAFRSTRELRLLHPARNVAVFAWEFPVLKTETLPDENPIDNQHAMLAAYDEIWVPSRFTRTVLLAHGLDRVHVIPAPLVLAAPPDRASARRIATEIVATPLWLNPAWPDGLQNERLGPLSAPLDRLLGAACKRPCCFLTVLNPEDLRKNLDAMIRGFHQHRQEFPDSVLLVKLLVPADRMTLAEAAGSRLSRRVGGAIADPGILFFTQFLSDPQMAALYAMADFYLCASIAEGQNLPLLEAMASGAVAVSPATTAMADYITPDTAVVMRTRSIRAHDSALAGRVAGRNFMIDQADPEAVAAALAAARGLSAAVRRRRALVGRAMVAARYAEPVVLGLSAARLASPAGAA